MGTGIKEHPMYIEGRWAASKMIKHIANTSYGTIDNAIAVKEELVKNFEKEFGYTRDMDPLEDSNYAHACGILDGLKHHIDGKS